MRLFGRVEPTVPKLTILPKPLSRMWVENRLHNRTTESVFLHSNYSCLPLSFISTLTRFWLSNYRYYLIRSSWRANEMKMIPSIRQYQDHGCIIGLSSITIDTRKSQQQIQLVGTNLKNHIFFSSSYKQLNEFLQNLWWILSLLVVEIFSRVFFLTMTYSQRFLLEMRWIQLSFHWFLFSINTFKRFSFF